MGKIRFLCACIGLAGTILAVLSARAEEVEVTLDDGRILTGVIGEVSAVGEDPSNSTLRPKQILVVHNGLSRTFVPEKRVRQQRLLPNSPDDSISIPQRVDKDGAHILLGEIGGVQPFDPYGRRLISMQRNGDVAHIVQGITKITPRYAVVEALEQRSATGGDFKWEMRMATSAIPRETLRAIFATYLDFSKLDDRLALVRLYVKAERYDEARQELDAIIKEHPDLSDDDRANLATQLRTLKQLAARQILDEMQLRRDAGQFALVDRLLANFPKQDVAGETLQAVNKMLSDLESQKGAAAQALARLDDLVGRLNDAGAAQRVRPLVEEIRTELAAHPFTLLPRLAAFSRLTDDEDLDPDHRVSLALSGWLLGSNNAMENLAVSLSLFQVRNLVQQYLRETTAIGRAQILSQLRSLEGAEPARVAQLLALMTPPLDIPPDAPVAGQPGLYKMSLVSGGAAVTYWIQTPPEYDPHRRYPTVVTLNGLGTTPEGQLDWWAGRKSETGRLGQATRRGYIVVAVDWRTSQLPRYGYTELEHNAVLASLRDAVRRFSIDTDRVFLSGYDIGGEAAWDIGLAHPDLWAGVIPISAVGDKYITRYSPNAEYVPTYFVMGELDATAEMTDKNAVHFNNYLLGARKGQPTGFDMTLVEYIGRGHERFSDDVQNIFDWMDRRKRDFFPQDFAVNTMRAGDQFFWWVELAAVPPRFVVDPVDWPPPKQTFELSVEGRVNGAGDITVNTGQAPVTVWLSPEVVDFESRFKVTVKGKSPVRNASELAQPDLEVMLEDVRTRSDRQHPFWARLVVE